MLSGKRIKAEAIVANLMCFRIRIEFAGFPEKRISALMSSTKLVQVLSRVIAEANFLILESIFWLYVNLNVYGLFFPYKQNFMVNGKNMQTNNDTKKSLFSERRAISPILATVILLGIAVVGGGLAFAVFSSGMTAATASNVITIENAQAVKGTDHADVTATVKNSGNKPWDKIQMTVAKTALSEPLLYESLHENAAGCSDASSPRGSDNTCASPFEGRANPLRMQWLAALDKKSGQDGRADTGEGASVGRKLVFENKDSYRTILVLNGTSVGPLFGLVDQNGNSLTDYDGDVTTCDAHGSGATWLDCSAVFDDLDSSTDGTIACRAEGGSTSNDNVECKVYTHTNLNDDLVEPGEGRYFYADAFVSDIPGLNNQLVEIGDELVVNIATQDKDGGTARAQTIIKVTG